MNQHEDSKDNPKLLECITRLLGGLAGVRSSLTHLATLAADEGRTDWALSIHSAGRALDRCELEVYSTLNSGPGPTPSDGPPKPGPETGPPAPQKAPL